MYKITPVLSLALLSLPFTGLSHVCRFDTNVHPIIVSDPASITAGSNATGTVTVDRAGSSDTVITLSSSDTTQLTVPSTVTVLAGQTTANFTITAPSTASTSAKVEATANGESVYGAKVLVEGD